MNIKIQQMRIFSQDGDKEYPKELIIQIDELKKYQPITFYSGGLPVFSLGKNEVDAFCEAIQQLVP